jgi:hypothetical protein
VKTYALKKKHVKKTKREKTAIEKQNQKRKKKCKKKTKQKTKKKTLATVNFLRVLVYYLIINRLIDPQKTK